MPLSKKTTRDLNKMYVRNIHLKNLRRSVFKEAMQVEQYPFYAMAVPTLLQQPGFRPHQELLAAGLIKECTADDDVIFISHQWLAFDSPDPKNEQFDSLKRMLERLLAGELTVESNEALQMIYGVQICTTPDEWQRRLPNTYVWIDYQSVPQPKAQIASADHRQAAAGATGDGDSVVDQLRAAVDSIPTFVERCSQMWVLAPPCKHADLAGEICDFASWRARGWCRLEYAAAKLARGDDMPIMVIRSVEGTPQYFNPCDTMKLAAARGRFTVEEDRAKVNATLRTMLEAKIAHFAQLGDVTLSRVLRCFSPIFLPKIDAAEEEEGKAAAGSGGAAGGGLEAVKATFGWRDDLTEAKWQAHTGWSLLTLACAVDDEAAVRALLATPEGKKMLTSRGKMASPKDTPLRNQPFSKLFLDMATGMTPLMAAVTFSRPSVIDLVLDAGAPMPYGTKLFGDSPCQFRGIFASKVDNLKLLLRRFPELAAKVNQTGTTCTHFACMLSREQGQCDILRELLERGAGATLSTQHMLLGTPLMVLGANPDADPGAAKLLHEAAVREGGGRGLALPGVRTVIAKVIAVVMRTQKLVNPSNISATGLLLMLKSGPGRPHPSGTTAVHIAAQRGHVAMVKAMAEVVEPDALRAVDAYGTTPIGRAHLTLNGAYDEALEPVLGRASPAEVEAGRGGRNKARAGGAAGGARGSGEGWVNVTPAARVAPHAGA